MSSWLSFNDSLNNIKGQITNFATSVLADDEDNAKTSTNFDDLRKICLKQEQEINQLRTLLEEQRVTNQYGTSSESTSHTDSWNWDETKDPKQISPSKDEIITDLKVQLTELQKEKNELITQLDQLDVDNQQNISKIMAIKDKLQEECNDIKEKLSKAVTVNNKLSKNEAKLQKAFDDLSVKYEDLENRLLLTAESNKSDLKVQQLLEDNQKLRIANEEMQKQISVLESAKSTLEKILEDMKKCNETTDESLKEVQAEKKIIYSELQKAKQTIEIFEKKSIEDSDNCAKLAVILETYEKQVGSLKEELEQQKLSHEEECLKRNQELESLKIIHEERIRMLEQDAPIKNSEELIENSENIHERYKTEISQLKHHNEEECAKLKQEIESLRELYEDKIKVLEHSLQKKRSSNQEELQQIHDKIFSEVKSEIHLKYVKILTENVKRYMDEESNIQNLEADNDPQVNEFNKQVENLIKILSEFKHKCETLETEVYELTQEKTKILSEKNYEIEKLIQNSELLSQDLLSKSQTLKEFENECTELEKNNELLIKELDSFKNTSGLQTISESNEDNLLLLESQLENSNKRVEDLERIIDELEKQQDTNNSDNIYNLNMKLQDSEKRVEELEQIIVDMEKDKQCFNNENYEALSKKYDEVVAEHNIVCKKIQTFEKVVQKLTEENDELKSVVDKLKTDLDNSEYQLTEDNVNMETIKEECESLKKKNDALIEENKTLTVMHSETEKSNEDIRLELNSFREKLLLEEDLRHQAESQIKVLTEKLQHSKVLETTLKLQCDTLNKELHTVSEAKHLLEVALQKTNENVQKYENNYKELQDKNHTMTEHIKILEDKNSELNNIVVTLNKEKDELKDKLVGNTQKHEVNFNNETEAENSTEILKESSESNYKQLQEKIVHLETELEKTNLARTELINLIQTKDQESISYYNEIQRLSQILRNEAEKTVLLENQLRDFQQLAVNRDEMEILRQENEKLTDQNSFLRQKCEVLADNLLQEQSKVHNILAERSSSSDKETALTKELERLKSHLIEVEETLTQELVETERKNAELLNKMKDIEEREKNSSTMYTSISIRANQQVEVLQKQVQSLTSQRDDLRNKISEAEDQNNKQAAALANLQLVLEQFQKDREKDVYKETERIRRQINAEKLVQDELKKEINDLKQQLDESKQGLQAATRLSEQLGLSKKLNTSLKEEVTQLKIKLEKSEEKIKNLTGQTDGKIEKSLIKNLIIGYVSCNKNMNKDQTQILKIIATVLDFNQQDHDKVNSSQNQPGSWLGSLLMPQSGQNMTEESLSKAFVKFLENESKPRIVPSLLSPPQPSDTAATSKTSKTSSPRQSPIVLSEIVLPTFADFSQNRNSSSILKDVLKDSSNNN